MSATAESNDIRSLRATVLTLTWLAGVAGHELGDYLAQRDHDAVHKQDRDWVGRLALARHAVSYAATQAAVKWLTYRVTGVRVPGRALLAGAAVEAVLHAVIDDGRPLRRLAEAIDKTALHDLKVPGMDGCMVMDQACHRGAQIPVGAVVTMLVAGDTR